VNGSSEGVSVTTRALKVSANRVACILTGGGSGRVGDRRHLGHPPTQAGL
jgi:hypothetical protein